MKENRKPSDLETRDKKKKISVTKERIKKNQRVLFDKECSCIIS